VSELLLPQRGHNRLLHRVVFFLADVHSAFA
jgi:hypothetical protein